jgi:hypothetical protein
VFDKVMAPLLDKHERDGLVGKKEWLAVGQAGCSAPPCRRHMAGWGWITAQCRGHGVAHLYRLMAANGPGPIPPSSITRMPSKAPAIVVVLPGEDFTGHTGGDDNI